ncbi:hypothetical protein ACP275_09G139300 [Erythranthe tilingii]
MVSIGLKGLPSRRHKSHSLSEDRLTPDEGTLSCNNGGRTRKMGRKGSKKNEGFHGDASTENRSGGAGKPRKFETDNAASVSEASFVRKQVDPDTTKYFTEISNAIEGTEVDFEERSVICGNALEEARGKEVELATDYIISHTMQALLENCSVDHLCSFLQSCVYDFAHVSMDKSGSHVAETALKSLARHLEDNENHSLVEATVSALCEAIVVNPVDIMCNCYGSHVLRRLLCLCKGVPMDTLEFHTTNPSLVLAQRLNLRSSLLDGSKSQENQPFPDQLKFLVTEIVNPSKADVGILLGDQYSSLVLQAALKLLAGQDEELFRLIPILLGCPADIVVEPNFIEGKVGKKILRLVEENAYSHLMEVILAVAPDSLYNEIFMTVFKGSLFRMSSHRSGNFVVQALVAHARTQDHIKLIFEELGSKFRNLIELGRTGVVAALIGASQRLKIYEHKCCQALADAVCLANESSACIVPRLFFLDNYLYSNDKANWYWPNGAKMHVLGSLILESVFKFPSEHIQAYITSLMSLEANHVLELTKHPAGARVIEAFLVSNASAKHKHKLIIKLQGHFGELSVLNSGSYTVDKCFNASNVSLREKIVSELVSYETELSKTRQGPYLLKKLDVTGFAREPDQWRSRQTSKQSIYNEFYEAFGPKDAKPSRSENFLSNTRPKPQAENLKGMREEINSRLNSAFPSSSVSPFLAHQGKPKKSGNKHVPEGRGFAKDDENLPKSKRHKTGKTSNSTENTNGVEIHDEKSSTVKEKKRRRKDGLSKSSDKKLKAGNSD